MSLFAFEHVTMRYPDGRRPLTPLEDVCFEVDDGDFLGVWGTRRSGKSTLLRVAAGIELPSDGVVRFAGQDTTVLSGDARAALLRHRGFGLVSSERLPDDRHSTVEYVAAPLLADSLTLRKAKRVARTHLDRLGVLGCAEMRPERLSRGELFRVELARALAHEPRLLFVDEPAVLIDPREREELYELLCSLRRSHGCALLVVSEDVAVIRIARRVMTLGKGILRSTDREGQIVPFPKGRAPVGQSNVS